jgi:tyrosine-protein phosphatase SIW14
MNLEYCINCGADPLVRAGSPGPARGVRNQVFCVRDRPTRASASGPGRVWICENYVALGNPTCGGAFESVPAGWKAGLALWVLLGCAAVSLPAAVPGAAVTGILNFHQVSARIYRGAQPNVLGWDSLAKLGVKTVIDLRTDTEHDCAAEKRQVEAAGMRYVNVPLREVHAPSDRQISNALNLVDDSASPIFLHCRRGADRTGTVIACYRIAHDGWTNRRALQEAVSYGMSWLEFGMQRYVLAFHPAGSPPAPPSAPPPVSPPVPPQIGTLN